MEIRNCKHFKQYVYIKSKTYKNFDHKYISVSTREVLLLGRQIFKFIDHKIKFLYSVLNKNLFSN